MTSPAHTIDEVFASYLPSKLASRTLPEPIRAGALMFVSRGESSRAWKLYGPEGQSSGGHFEPCSADSSARCTITMAEADLLALGQNKLNLQMAFMSGRLKVTGDMACAMQLGALFG